MSEKLGVMLELYRDNDRMMETVERVNDSYLEMLDALEGLEDKHAKLREQAEKAWKAAEMLCQAWDGPCHADGVPIKPPCPLDERDELCVYGQLQRDLRELGVEVDG